MQMEPEINFEDLKVCVANFIMYASILLNELESSMFLYCLHLRN